MACKVNHGLLVCLCHILNYKLVVVCERIFYSHLHLSREAFFAIRACIFQHQCLCVHLQCFPNLGIVAFLAAMQAVRTIVDGEMIYFAIELELSFAYSVAVASYKC